jgi:hypothetical protein
VECYIVSTAKQLPMFRRMIVASSSGSTILIPVVFHAVAYTVHILQAIYHKTVPTVRTV